MTDTQRLEQLFSEQKYMVFAVVLDDGTPWVVPVRIRKYVKGKIFEWDSNLLAEHSKVIVQRPAAAITVFHKWDDHQTGYYAKGTAELIEEFKPGLGHYRFTAIQAWLNDETFKKREIQL
jgi:predicted pyridoxine 5'-phosphate oxidase superfamily flavin-nucleotide-binding protein